MCLDTIKCGDWIQYQCPFFKEANIRVCVVEINAWRSGAVLKLSNSEYLGKHQIVRKLEADPNNGYKDHAMTGEAKMLLKFDLKKGKLSQEVSDEKGRNIFFH